MTLITFPRSLGVCGSKQVKLVKENMEAQTSLTCTKMNTFTSFHLIYSFVFKRHLLRRQGEVASASGWICVWLSEFRLNRKQKWLEKCWDVAAVENSPGVIASTLEALICPLTCQMGSVYGIFHSHTGEKQYSHNVISWSPDMALAWQTR